MEHKSQYDDRETVGAIYRRAQIEHDGSQIEVGDMCREIMSSLVCDLNDTIQSKPHGDRDYYITIHESKDLQMKNCLRRRILTSVYRPWPEDDTTVFKVGKNGDIRFCWCLYHHSEMDNILNNPGLYDADLIREIKDWKNLELHRFGFMKDQMGHWIPNPHYQDKKLENQLIQGPRVLVA